MTPFRRLDFLPPWGAWALGIGCGAVAGAALLGAAPGATGVIGFLGLLGAAAWLAASGEPIAVLERAERPIVPPLEQSAAHPLVDLVEISGGSFLMGSPESEEGRFDNEGPVHQIRLSPFACMRFPVTRRLYSEIVGVDPGWPEGDANDRPVNNVSWFDAVTFCNWLSEWEGLVPFYKIEGEQVSWNRPAGGYRLLTEAEWEYACRAGSSERFYFGDDEVLLHQYGWFKGNSNGEIQPVGRKLPNVWGLHDMHGNLWEWCWDWFGRYSAGQYRDPTGPDEGSGRAVRGGAFLDTPFDLRSSERLQFPPEYALRYVGFRCARSLSDKPWPLSQRQRLSHRVW
ncbi:MAG TPA: formylglycine-generating enzyme family protein [Thermoanaerobaculia bacterium]|nr:formylglycine-generating enzyme family protein [Thermoanaerobaculia bacterium]